jgi:hypothetical protein
MCHIVLITSTKTLLEYRHHTKLIHLTMTLEVHPIESTDAGACVDIRIERLGSLVIGRPIPDPKSGYRDGRIASIERDLNDRPHVHNLKIIDTEMKNRIIAYARWEIHEFGRPSSNVSATPKDNAAKGIDEVQELLELRHDMNVYFRARDKEIGNKPHIRKLTHQSHMQYVNDNH